VRTLFAAPNRKGKGPGRKPASNAGNDACNSESEIEETHTNARGFGGGGGDDDDDDDDGDDGDGVEGDSEAARRTRAVHRDTLGAASVIRWGMRWDAIAPGEVILRALRVPLAEVG
jgi:hypothetical protein